MFVRILGRNTNICGFPTFKWWFFADRPWFSNQKTSYRRTQWSQSLGTSWSSIQTWRSWNQLRSWLG